MNTDCYKAYMIANRAHKGQVDKAGKPYILHPLYVMSKMHTEEEAIVAILHDVIEDTDCTLDAPADARPQRAVHELHYENQG